MKQNINNHVLFTKFSGYAVQRCEDIPNDLDGNTIIIKEVNKNIELRRQILDGRQYSKLSKYGIVQLWFKVKNILFCLDTPIKLAQH